MADDERPAGGPYTTGGVQVHRALLGGAPNVLCIMVAGSRCEILLGSPMNPPQL